MLGERATVVIRAFVLSRKLENEIDAAAADGSIVVLAGSVARYLQPCPAPVAPTIGTSTHLSHLAALGVQLFWRIFAPNALALTATA
jgi:hypothetical protein